MVELSRWFDGSCKHFTISVNSTDTLFLISYHSLQVVCSSHSFAINFKYDIISSQARSVKQRKLNCHTFRGFFPPIICPWLDVSLNP